MKSVRRWMLGGAAAGIAYALIAFAPASWLASGLAAASGGQVLLQTPRGTAWQGSADVVLSGGAGSSDAVSLPSRMAWRLRPVWIGLDLSLDAPCCAPAASPVQIGLRAGSLASPFDVSWQVDAPKLAFPADMLTGLGAPWNTLQLGGDLSLMAERLSGIWSRNDGLAQIAGRADLQASNVTTALSTVRPLGNYRLSSTGAALVLETKPSAALVLSGAGQMVQGRVSFQGEALAAVGFEDALSNLLHIIGQWQPSTDGRSRAVLKI
jgi:general secretion pathway protein N